MTELAERLQRWRALSAEARVLFRRNDELLESRAELLHAASTKFRDMVRIARAFNDAASAAEGPDQPAAGSASPRSR